MSRRPTASWLLAGWSSAVCFAVLFTGCRGGEQTGRETPEGEAEAIVQIDPPAAAGSFAPRLVVSEDELLMTWWEPLESKDGEAHHRLMFSRHTGSWSEPSVVAEGLDFFANWADFPTVIREPAGSLLVHWLAKTAEETFAYSIYLARSKDDGESWQEIGKLNDDDTDTEHGFVSLVREGTSVRAYWLDGRLMADGGPMTVRSALIGESVGASELLDDRVCECCPTDAVETPGGSMVAYRDRSEDERRDIFAVARTADEWTEPSPLTRDEWRIPGCPVNGPAIDHRNGSTAMAWFTGAENTPRVRAGFADAVGAPVSSFVIDEDGPLGRVGLVLDEQGDAIVSWLARSGARSGAGAGDEAEIRLRRIAPGGELGRALAVGRTAASRASGVPQLGRAAERLYVAWLEVSESVPGRIRVSEIATPAVPIFEAGS